MGVLRDLVLNGTTLLLTTQYLEEADYLADEIVVIDKGRVIAAGTPTALKDQAGEASVVVTLTDARDIAAAEQLMPSCSPRCTWKLPAGGLRPRRTGCVT